MNTVQTIENRLWDYIDGGISEEERFAIENLLQENTDWKQKYEELLILHQSISSPELQEPSMRFRINVMEAIHKTQFTPATKIYINKKIIWAIGFFFISTIISLLIYGLGQVEWSFSNSTNLKMPVDFSKINYDFFSNPLLRNAFIMINIVLGLMLFDNYLTTRKKIHL